MKARSVAPPENGELDKNGENGRKRLMWTARILRAHEHERAGCARSNEFGRPRRKTT